MIAAGCPRLGVGMETLSQGKRPQETPKHTKAHRLLFVLFVANLSSGHFPNAEGVTHRSPASPVPSSTKDKRRTVGQTAPTAGYAVSVCTGQLSSGILFVAFPRPIR